ncbi:hypothetical protein LBMAG15_16090 [Actinomycetes bacterium]|nr:hypothetical protein LBMAG15_16090 [Actinomycetes bacterium]
MPVDGAVPYPVTMPTFQPRIAIALLAAGVAAAALGAGPASAAVNPAKYEQAQVGLTYTVYKPTTSIDLKTSSFQLTDCGGGKDEQINASFGSQMSNKGWISLTESQTGCEDGPDGVGPVTTFTIDGATATIMGSCKGGKSTCTKSNPAQLRKGQGYTTVTLPAGSSALKSTFVEVYTDGMSVKEIKAFFAGLKPVQ